jgi:hypothetical protein
MAFIFPSNPNIGDLVTNPASGQIFRWNGFAWGGDSANALLTASFAFTASHILGGVATSSFAISSSYAINAGSASYIKLDDIAAAGDYGNDETAAINGVPIGGVYRNGNFMMIRYS